MFDRLFGEGGTKEERVDRMKKRRSLLDRVNADLTRQGGRHLAFAPSDQVPMTNLLVSLLDKAGVTVEKLGDSTGRVNLDTLTGM